MSELPVDAGGRLWSPSLDSFLVPEREYLRLYDRNGQRRLTEAEAEALAEKLRSLGVDPDQV